MKNFINDLYTFKGIQAIHTAFLTFLQKIDEADYQLLHHAYQHHETMPSFEKEDLCLKIAPTLELFMMNLFSVNTHVEALQKRNQDLLIVSKVKRLFIQRFVALQKRSIPAYAPKETYTDIEFARLVEPFLNDLNNPELDPLIDYALWHLNQKDASPLFTLAIKKTPIQSFFDQLSLTEKGYVSSVHHSLSGSFSCTDPGISYEKAVDQSAYCIKCHPNGRDSCSKGLLEKPEKKGCPLGVKISPMMGIYGRGYVVGALAIICVDNPLLPLTGHRICNDCRLSCIYQKQEPVDVPGVESRILKDVLMLPFGFEIYSLLTRWNPLKFDAPYMKEKTGHNVLVVGQGPAGIGLAHELMFEGICVFAIDGLKIEPIADHLLDTSNLIQNIYDHLHDLEDRITYGFGGVAEYGITVRFDKNNLFIVRLLLERNKRYTLQGGVRYGSQITYEQALGLGFDHIALCTGAGSPKMLPLKKGSVSLPLGVRFASDFLMGLQLTGVFKQNSVANLSVELPIVVIGGGLTAIDTATEAQRYYIRQVKKTAQQIQTLKAQGTFDTFLQTLTPRETDQLNRWLAHAQALEGVHDAIPFMHQNGGATILYRKEIKDAPSIALNVEEVQKAMEEGIFIKDQVSVTEFIVDDAGALSGIRTTQGDIIPARSAFIAIGCDSGSKMITP
ncbi:MAG: hypothetical protein CNLJKLNK_00353 [Holosporales bacterium]